jgi:hypothetical protein
MTHQELDEMVANLVTQLSTGSSSPTQAGWIEPIPGQADVVPERLPIHLLFVDARSRAAHAVIEPSGAASVHLCT